MYSWQTRMKHIEGGKNFGDKFLSTFPSASKPFSLRQLFQPARLACHDILRIRKDRGMGASSISISLVSMIPPSTCYTRCSTNTFNVVSRSRMEEDHKNIYIFFFRRVIPGAPQMHIHLHISHVILIKNGIYLKIVYLK